MASAVNRPVDRDNILQNELDEARALVAQLQLELAEVDHRVANSLHLVSSLLKLQQRRLGDGAARNALGDALTRIEAVAQLHRLLYRQGTTREVDFAQYLHALAAEVGTVVGLHCDVHADRVMLDSERAINLAVATNELVTNAGKYAYGGKPGGAVEIVCRCDGDELLLSVADGGPGLPPGFCLSGAVGLGLSLVKGIVSQLGGSLTAESNQGAIFALRVPLAPARSG